VSFICFDTEDDSKELAEQVKAGVPGASMFNKRVTQIAAINGEGARYYNKGGPEGIADFKRWLLQQPDAYVYALNVGYDIGNLFGKKELDKLDTTQVGSRIISMKWGPKCFVDVFNIWPMSVKKLGQAFGLEKLETDDMANDKEYVFRDVEIIRKAMLFAWQFCEMLSLKNLSPTLGGLSVKVWKNWGGVNVHDSTKASREALFGGRVELFKVVSESNAVCWTDINSLYPSVMRRKFPGTLEDTGKELKAYGVAQVTIQVPKGPLPVLPFRQDSGRIVYPWGKFTGTWTIEEIRAAEREGAKILKVFQAYSTDEYIIPYGTFVDRLYKARQDSDSETERLFFKLLMNNLYGRLGSSGVIARTVWQTEKNKKLGIPYGDKVLIEYSMPLAEETNWSHAAYVSAYGRLELHKYLKLIGPERLIYCDTDGIFFDCPDVMLAMRATNWESMLDNGILPCSIPFPVSSELGAMKLERWVSSAECHAPKMYRAGKIYKAKGVPQRLAKEFIKTGHAEYDLPYKFREAATWFDRGNVKQLSVWRTVQKFRRSKYDRKTLTGNRFFPCQVNAV
jgi:hypothetical protein